LAAVRRGALESRSSGPCSQGRRSPHSGITPVALAFTVLDLTGSTGDLGLDLAAASVPMLASLLVGGVWAGASRSLFTAPPALSV
jgi:hypothetical protein